jgi:hypothetical protein
MQGKVIGGDDAFSQNTVEAPGNPGSRRNGLRGDKRSGRIEPDDDLTIAAAGSG